RVTEESLYFCHATITHIDGAAIAPPLEMRWEAHCRAKSRVQDCPRFGPPPRSRKLSALGGLPRSAPQPLAVGPGGRRGARDCYGSFRLPGRAAAQVRAGSYPHPVGPFLDRGISARLEASFGDHCAGARQGSLSVAAERMDPSDRSAAHRRLAPGFLREIADAPAEFSGCPPLRGIAVAVHRGPGQGGVFRFADADVVSAGRIADPRPLGHLPLARCTPVPAGLRVVTGGNLSDIAVCPLAEKSGDQNPNHPRGADAA